MKTKTPEEIAKMNIIQDTVTEIYNIDKTDIIGRDRHREYSIPRHITVYFIKKVLDLSYKEIGETLGSRDHSTAIHSCRVVNNLIDTDKKFRGQIELMKKIINNNILQYNAKKMVCGFCGSFDIIADAKINFDTKDILHIDRSKFFCPSCNKKTLGVPIKKWVKNYNWLKAINKLSKDYEY